MPKTVEYYDGPEDASSLVRCPLPWQEKGLQQTASGYGSKLTTSFMLRVGKRLHRIYCISYSNAGSFYIIHQKRRKFLRFFS